MNIYSCQRVINSSVPKVFNQIKIIGGDNGWYYANWLWRLRGLIDKLLGGIGFRKGRTDNINLKVGDKLDFWVVEEFVEDQKISLKAEINTFGKGWMEFIVINIDEKVTLLNLKALYIPNGWFGKIYWTLVYPLHILVFNGLLRSIEKRVTKPI